MYLTIVGFTATRVDKLISRRDPTVFEISTGEDLDLGSRQQYKIEDMAFKIGSVMILYEGVYD